MWLSLANNVCTFYRRILNSFLFKQPRQTPVATRRATLSKNSTSNSSNLILIDSMLCNDKKKGRTSRSLLHVFTFFGRQFILLFYYCQYIIMCRLTYITQWHRLRVQGMITLQTKQKPQNKTFSMNLYLCFRLFCYMLKL